MSEAYSFINDEDDDDEKPSPPRPLESIMPKRAIKSQRYSSLLFTVIACFCTYLVPSPLKPTMSPMYPLYKEPHNTTSIVFTGSYMNAARVVGTLKHHMKQNPHFTILCMHHLKGISPYYRICIVYNDEEYITMFNPRIIGKSKEITIENERSISCNHVLKNNRNIKIRVEWNDNGGYIMSSTFKGATSILLQLIIDEQLGKINCLE